MSQLTLADFQLAERKLAELKERLAAARARRAEGVARMQIVETRVKWRLAEIEAVNSKIFPCFQLVSPANIYCLAAYLDAFGVGVRSQNGGQTQDLAAGSAASSSSAGASTTRPTKPAPKKRPSAASAPEPRITRSATLTNLHKRKAPPVEDENALPARKISRRIAPVPSTAALERSAAAAPKRIVRSSSRRLKHTSE
ncbi:hypothetical protein C8R46DRAFT_1308348 [Mycena filopes]|nr:hypothetical protein C8R46DRAFT_1308348 [Mycena filopes]